MFAFGLLAISFFPIGSRADDSGTSFVAIENVPQSATKIRLGPSCYGVIVPNTTFTVKPSNNSITTVSSFPEDLVEIDGYNSDILAFRWSRFFVFEEEGPSCGAGVVIAMPADQLQQVHLSCSSRVQILDGFTGLTDLSVSSSSELYAQIFDDATTEEKVTSEQLSISVSSGSRATVATATMNEASASSGSLLELDVDILQSLSVSSGSAMKLTGSVVDGSLSSGSVLEVGGAVASKMSVSSGSTIQVAGNFEGTISASSGSGVYVTTSSLCSKVSTSSGSSCSVKDVSVPVVDVEELDLVAEAGGLCNFLSIFNLFNPIGIIFPWLSPLPFLSCLFSMCL